MDHPFFTLALSLILPGLLVGWWAFFSRGPKIPIEPLATELLRKQLPENLYEWRHNKRYITAWNTLRRFFAAHGYKLWSFDSQRHGFLTPAGHELVNPNGFCYVPPTQNHAASVNLRIFSSSSLLWPAGHSHGDVVIRILSSGGQGRRQLNIQRQVATAPVVMIRSNHSLPLFREIVLQDIVFGVFPRVTTNLAQILVCHGRTSEIDMVGMLAQCIEGLAFLHGNLIAHLNVFPENFLVDFPPDSTSPKRLTGRPRVYITDFESAVSFPLCIPPEERKCGAEQFFEEDYRRPRAPELQPLTPISPFPVDCWQFSAGIREKFIQTNNTTLTAILESMHHREPTSRPTAADVLIGLQDVENAMIRATFARK